MVFSGPREAEQLKTKPTRSSPLVHLMQEMPSCRLRRRQPSGPQDPGPPYPVHWLGHLPPLPNSELGNTGDCRQLDGKVVSQGRHPDCI